jgi:CheY-like chemotaxis protein
VLVVVDESDLIDLVTHHLEGAGSDVVSALRAEEGLGLARSEALPNPDNKKTKEEHPRCEG